MLRVASVRPCETPISAVIWFAQAARVETKNSEDPRIWDCLVKLIKHLWIFLKPGNVHGICHMHMASLISVICGSTNSRSTASFGWSWWVFFWMPSKAGHGWPDSAKTRLVDLSHLRWLEEVMLMVPKMSGKRKAWDPRSVKDMIDMGNLANSRTENSEKRFSK